MPTRTMFDVDRIASGIGRKTISRRAVAKGAAWSLPVLATGIAAPAVAQSPEICSCKTEQRCFIEASSSAGECRCARGLVCVEAGPFGLADVCVGAGLLSTDCGGGECYGVCLSGVHQALDNFSTQMALLGWDIAKIVGYSVAFEMSPMGNVPTNVCVSPFGDGKLGSLCRDIIETGNLQNAEFIDDVTDVVNTLTDSLGASGVTLGTTCSTGFVCSPIAGATVKDHANTSGSSGSGTLTAHVGVCVCPGTPTPSSSSEAHRSESYQTKGKASDTSVTATSSYRADTDSPTAPNSAPPSQPTPPDTPTDE